MAGVHSADVLDVALPPVFVFFWFFLVGARHYIYRRMLKTIRCAMNCDQTLIFIFADTTRTAGSPLSVSLCLSLYCCIIVDMNNHPPCVLKGNSTLFSPHLIKKKKKKNVKVTEDGGNQPVF